MSLGSPLIRYWYHPTADSLGDTVEAFLQEMAGPTLLHIPGKNRQRKRAICTLLHGNEPSGTRGIFRWLKQGVEPAVDILCFFGSVKTSLQEPLFFYRHLPDDKDLNRCFKAPFECDQGRLAKAILDILQDMQPEALIDIHNTSGMGPSFSVSMKQDAQHEALTSLFTERMLVTGLRLGALFEYSERNVPTVTIECGGAQDPRADEPGRVGVGHPAQARGRVGQPLFAACLTMTLDLLACVTGEPGHEQFFVTERDDSGVTVVEWRIVDYPRRCPTPSVIIAF